MSSQESGEQMQQFADVPSGMHNPIWPINEGSEFQVGDRVFESPGDKLIPEPPMSRRRFITDVFLPITGGAIALPVLIKGGLTLVQYIQSREQKDKPASSTYAETQRAISPLLTTIRKGIDMSGKVVEVKSTGGDLQDYVPDQKNAFYALSDQDGKRSTIVWVNWFQSQNSNGLPIAGLTGSVRVATLYKEASSVEELRLIAVTHPNQHPRVDQAIISYPISEAQQKAWETGDVQDSIFGAASGLTDTYAQNVAVTPQSVGFISRLAASEMNDVSMTKKINRKQLQASSYEDKGNMVNVTTEQSTVDDGFNQILVAIIDPNAHKGL